ncbi:hypothetical protein INT43_001478 [Umbelopsis isabellina]|uniref:Uncharacterized protein n=1 Tax=Mortierella isabellina TaxID=91625 RepID=A0A8H7PDP3_MORIS|nr:hypothetical protein INT43_001478 [Umbelopsis isabellina]
METYFGYIKCAQDALQIFKACHLGVLPRVRRRLSDRERSTIRSGSVFVWYEREAGMKRWTDGRSWSPSRVSGSFLTYKELNCKQKKHLSQPDQAVYKRNGLIKQSFSITTQSNDKIHLISYFTDADVSDRKLICPIDDPELAKTIESHGKNQSIARVFKSEHPVSEHTASSQLPQLHWQSPVPTTTVRYTEDEDNNTVSGMSIATTPSLVNSPDCNSVSTTSLEESQDHPALFALNIISKPDSKPHSNVDMSNKIQLPPIVLPNESSTVTNKYTQPTNGYCRLQEDERQLRALSQHLQLF